MPALVRGDDLQRGRQTESYAPYERISESNARQIEIGVRNGERSDLGVRGEKTFHRRAEARLRLRDDRPESFHPLPDRRFLGPGEPCPEESRGCRAFSEALAGAGRDRRLLHLRQVRVVRLREVIEALGDAPAIGSRTPAARIAGKAGHEGVRIAFHSIELFEQLPNLRCVHDHSSFLEYGSLNGCTMTIVS